MSSVFKRSGWAGLVVLAGLGAGASLAQTTAEMAEWREGIEAQRLEVERVFSAEQTACYQQFSVTDCLLRAKRTRGAALAELKRQELVLNDEERKRKAAAQVRKLDARNSLEAEQNAAAQRAQRAEAASAVRQRAADQVNTRSAAGQPPKPPTANEGQNGPGSTNGSRSVNPPKVPKAPKPPSQVDTSQAQQSFNRKQQEAAARQAEVDNARRERKQPLAAPLPPTGTAPTPLSPQLLAPLPKVPAQ